MKSTSAKIIPSKLEEAADSFIDLLAEIIAKDIIESAKRARSKDNGNSKNPLDLAGKERDNGNRYENPHRK